MKQMDIFDYLDERPKPKYIAGDKAKVRKPNETDDPETFAVLDKYKGEKVIVINSYWSESYHQYGYLLSFIKENISIALLENDLQ